MVKIWYFIKYDNWYISSADNFLFIGENVNNFPQISILSKPFHTTSYTDSYLPEDRRRVPTF